MFFSRTLSFSRTKTLSLLTLFIRNCGIQSCPNCCPPFKLLQPPTTNRRMSNSGSNHAGGTSRTAWGLSKRGFTPLGATTGVEPNGPCLLNVNGLSFTGASDFLLEARLLTSVPASGSGSFISLTNSGGAPSARAHSSQLHTPVPLAHHTSHKNSKNTFFPKKKSKISKINSRINFIQKYPRNYCSISSQIAYKFLLCFFVKMCFAKLHFLTVHLQTSHSISI